MFSQVPSKEKNMIFRRKPGLNKLILRPLIFTLQSRIHRLNFRYKKVVCLHINMHVTSSRLNKLLDRKMVTSSDKLTVRHGA